MGGTGVLHPTEISGRPKEVTTKILDQNLARTVNTAFLTIHYPPSQTFFFCFSNLPKVSLSHGTTFSQHLPAPQGAENNLFNHQSYFQQSPNNQTCRSSTLLEKCSKPDRSEASHYFFSFCFRQTNATTSLQSWTVHVLWPCIPKGEDFITKAATYWYRFSLLTGAAYLLGLKFWRVRWLLVALPLLTSHD